MHIQTEFVCAYAFIYTYNLDMSFTHAIIDVFSIVQYKLTHLHYGNPLHPMFINFFQNEKDPKRHHRDLQRPESTRSH